MTIHNINEMPEMTNTVIVLYYIDYTGELIWNIARKPDELCGFLQYDLIGFKYWFYLYELLSDNKKLLSKDFNLTIDNSTGM